MVSLGDTSRSSGAHFFSEDCTPIQDVETVSERVPILAVHQQSFPRIQAIAISVLIILLLVVCIIFAYVIPRLCQESGYCIIESWSALVCLQTCTWSLLLVLDQYFRCQYRRIRQCGYLQFYRQTRNLKRSALFIFSAGNAFMLAVLVILQEFCSGSGAVCFNSRRLQRITYMQLLVSTEVVMSLLSIILYFVKLIKFSKRRPLPDVNQDDLLASYVDFQAPRQGIGYRDEYDVDVVIEQQADVIQYLKQHNMNLGKKIVQLTSDLRRYQAEA